MSEADGSTEEEQAVVTDLERRLGNAEAASRYWHGRYEDEDAEESYHKDLLLMERYLLINLLMRVRPQKRIKPYECGNFC